MSQFKDLGLNPRILQALEEMGFEKPTPIQEKTIPFLIGSEKDVIALAQTGTGKTAAFSLPIIQKIDESDTNTQCLVLCPTRELAIQIEKDINNFTKYSPGIKSLAVFGGEMIDKQIRSMRDKPQIVVGTPGRVNDLIRRRVLKVESIKWLILDEADEMLNMGFKEEIDETIINMPEQKQVLLFSATMNRSVRRIADNYMKKPHDIAVENQEQGSKNIEHFYYMVHEKDRYQALRRIADMNPDIHGIIFCRTKRETQQVADKLMQDNYSAEAIHGDISQEQRTLVMNRFRDKKTQLLVATDVAARGIDVNGLTHIINYNLPESVETYVHRSGRTGRAHNTGISLVIVNMREQYRIKALERQIGQTFEKGMIPTGEQICERQLFNLIDNVCQIEINEKQINKYLELINKKFENMEREELIKKFVSVEFNRFLEHYQNASDLNTSSPQEREQPRKSSMLFSRFSINVGRNAGINVKDLLQFLNSQPELRSVEIGNITISDSSTVFEIDDRYKNQIMEIFKNIQMNGLNIEIICEASGIESSRDFYRKESRPPRRGGFSPRRNGGGGGGGRPPRRR
ncbi:DEAD/DEAH box helicase [Candidatus Peregrinibacteria bacterium CG10_big_fil_rev_8_21_14_0_10_36_19]|nr:MAG: DEAD/DEAH box helicase [Candidatus Peregrinibacteria bacterium CG10_big_fil_rev_8_21_14_0_10_36_19]